MSTTPVIIDPGSKPFDPSMAELETMLGPESPAPVEEPKPEAAEAPPQEEAKSPETDPAPVETKPEPEKDEPLPPAVQKRIDKEIAKAVSARKEAEAIVARLKEKDAKPGPEPAKTPQATASDKPARPARPVFGEKADEPWSEFKEREKAYEQALDKYEDDLRTWITKTTTAEVERRAQAKVAEEAHKRTWEAAVKEHGETFPSLVDEVAAKTPEPLQLAILQFEHWPALAVHLARNPAKHEELVSRFNQSQVAGIAMLGRMEASLKTEPKPAAKKEPLPAPPAKVGGGATASPAVDLNEGDFNSFAKAYQPILSRE